jgi:hypothetical protein
VADEDCEVALVWDMQSPVTCVPPAVPFPPSCEGVDAFCYAVLRGDAARVIPASYNGFFHRPDVRSWPAAGPLAAGIRAVLLSLDPGGQRWDVAQDRVWVREKPSVEAPVLLQRPGRLFVYIARTGTSASLRLRASAGADATLYTLIPLRKVSTAKAVDDTLTIVLPGDASNLAIAVTTRND